MKVIIVLCLSLALFNPAFAHVAQQQAQLTLPSNLQSLAAQHSELLTGGVVEAGAGYSTDAQQVAPFKCFKTTETPPKNGETIVSLSSAKKFDELEQELHINVSLSGQYGMFSASAEADYMRSIQDKDYSLSLNYYEYSTGTASVNPVGYGTNTLNDVGLAAYQDGDNPYFGVACGDYLINHYEQGALLIMSININFSSRYEKEQFEGKAGGAYGDFASASTSIQQIAIDNHLHGTVDIQAFQRGGDPSQLSAIISPSADGHYDVLSCDLQNMDACTKAAGRLLEYASNDTPSSTIQRPFITQFSYASGEGLAPLGPGFMKTTPIHYLGLNTPQSLVTPGSDIDNNRQYLAQELKKNQFYQQKLKEIVYGYPINLNKTGEIYSQSVKLLERVNNNLNEILQPANPSLGALACYDNLTTTTNNCLSVTARIKQRLIDLNADDLSYLAPIKYMMKAGDDGMYFQTANANDQPSCDYLPNSGKANHTVHHCYLSDNIFDVNALTNGQPGFWLQSTKSGISSNNEYIGHLMTVDKDNNSKVINNYITHKKLSPFYFGAYEAVQ